MIKAFKSLSKFEKILWLSSVFLVSCSFLISNKIDMYTYAASVVGVTALIFVAKGNAVGQVLIIIFSILYAIPSFKMKYYGEVITYMGMTAPIAIVSLYIWIKNPYSENQVKIRKLLKKDVFYLFILTLTVTVLFYFILKFFGTANLLFSTLSIATSFSASSLTALRTPYYAIAYALNDLVLIVLWVMATIADISYLPMIICFAVFFVNDIYGFISWKNMKKQQSENI